MRRNLTLIICLMIAAAAFMFDATPVSAQAADTAILVKQATQSLRNAEKAMHEGKSEEALKIITETEAMMKSALEKDPNNIPAKLLQKKVANSAKNIRKRAQASAPASVPAAVDKATSKTAEAAPAAGGAPLPSGADFLLKQADHRLDKIDQLIGPEGDRYSRDYREKAAKASVKEAREFMDTLESRHGEKVGTNHPEVEARKKRITRMEKQIADFSAAQDAKEAGEKASAAQAAGNSSDWIARLKPYVTPSYSEGYDAKKYLIPSATQDANEMSERLRIYAEATGEFSQYKAAKPASITSELEEIENKLETALGEFKDSMKEYGARGIEDISQKIKYAEEFVEEQKKKTENPLPMQRDMLPDLRRAVQHNSIFLDEGAPEIAGLNSRIDALEKADAEIRKKRVADTRMIAEAFKGKEKNDITKKAQEVLEKDKPGVKILRTAVISPEWKEESVVEYTDTTRTALRHRVTQSVSVQIAGKTDKGVHIYTLDISKDRKSDGSWAGLKGHVMFTDEILEENVNK